LRQYGNHFNLTPISAMQGIEMTKLVGLAVAFLLALRFAPSCEAAQSLRLVKTSTPHVMMFTDMPSARAIWYANFCEQFLQHVEREFCPLSGKYPTRAASSNAFNTSCSSTPARTGRVTARSLPLKSRINRSTKSMSRKTDSRSFFLRACNERARDQILQELATLFLSLLLR
jgi:hypothetical protein